MNTDTSIFRSALDRGEDVGSFEPLIIGEMSKHRAHLSDLSLELAAKSAGLKRSLPIGVVNALALLVRAMNCYYSNLIEGHDTHPIDIERAMKGDYSGDREKRNLQQEAQAHIAVQCWIDEGEIRGQALTSSGIKEIHRRFCERLPEELLWIVNPDTHEKMRVEPGEFRGSDVKVGRHVAVSAGAIPRFLKRFEEAYLPLGKAESIICAAAAHHRLLWIHPFLDGNGRVARLVSYALLLEALDTGGLWSISRGLARNEKAYKQHLAACDQRRRNDLDGRGNLSEEALAEFASFFLKICIDQVDFMENLMQPTRLQERITRWANEEIQRGRLPAHSQKVLEAVLYRGELLRVDIPSMLEVSDRQARRVTSALLERGVLTSPGHRAGLLLSFPASLAHIWMPGLFPDK